MAMHRSRLGNLSRPSRSYKILNISQGGMESSANNPLTKSIRKIFFSYKKALSISQLQELKRREQERHTLDVADYSPFRIDVPINITGALDMTAILPATTARKKGSPENHSKPINRLLVIPSVSSQSPAVFRRSSRKLFSLPQPPISPAGSHPGRQLRDRYDPC